MERVITIPIYETREIEPYPSCEGIQYKENISPKLAMMVKECPRFKRILEEDGGSEMKSSDWIKVEDRLPERGGKHNWTKNVLVHCPGPSDYDGEPNVTIAFYNHFKQQWYDLADNAIRVTRWMPIVGPEED